MKKTMTMKGSLALGCALATGAHAAVIDIDGRLADSNEASDLEWGDNSGRSDSGGSTPIGSNRPAPVVDSDGTVNLTVAANIQDWRTPTSSDPYEAGEEWNVRSSSNATTAQGAFTNNAFFSITLDSTALGGSLFDWDSVSVSLWRNGTGADTDFQLAIDADGNGFTVDDLVGTVSNPGAGIGGATTISFAGGELPQGVTTGEVRLYTWGQGSISGNIHLYDVVAEYTVVPEPSSALLFGLGGLFLVWRKRG
ncbi:PEP-CTERM sorting domain-containing protein [Roseibacillus ishigakijimensis]|uniref:PEP-CTERM sorting domain-containing protein n=1 Tax=Roseibacillus ishigakijimensis TaxID=454146 RepID=A0A934VLN3_9BACT|nr:PEP-CTERM sorting domain-containing protein [Roseibacillus ishigakijimensis]MBK1833281.1 PEP-CTERM sorting domain-containing protein [Roseibacillus ishigakijimensis]